MKPLEIPFDSSRVMPWRDWLRRFLSLLLALLMVCPGTPAQQATPTAVSDLASENLNRVAASATQIEEVLRKEPGLLVELKRWVAKEATDRGQLVEIGRASCRERV